MPTNDHPTPPARLDPTRRGMVLAILIGGIAVAVAVVVLNARGTPEAASSSSVPASPSTANATTTTIEAGSEVVGRLRDILGVRDRAYRERDADLLKGVFTTDCPCLKGDRKAIDQLLKDDAVWVGASTAIRVKNIEQVNDRLWIVTATFEGSPFRIETESGQLIRAVEGRSEPFRFALARTAPGTKLLLGFAGPINEAD